MITNIPYVQNSELSLSVLEPEYERVDVQQDVKFNQLVHDLKSPVNSLKGIVKLANTRIEDEQAKEYFYMINLCVDKLEEKILNTLNMFQNGMGLVDLAEINFETLLEGIMISLGHIEGFEKVRFSFDIENTRPFYSSKPILESIIQNLLENAIKYRCKDKEYCSVMVTIAESDSGVQIRIADDGIGIEREKLPHIFDANFKAMMSGKDSHGLGLFIVKKAVEKIHGTIEVKSAVGVGTSFTIDLPNGCDASKYVGAGNC